MIATCICLYPKGYYGSGFFWVLIRNAKMMHWMLWILPFSHGLKIESYQSDLIWTLTTSPMWFGTGGLSGILIISSIVWICLIWLNMRLFYWILFLKMSLSMWAVMTCTLLHFPVSCWLYMASKNSCTVVGYFLWIMSTQKWVLFLSGNSWFHGLLVVDW